jgi:CRISPR-associated protein (Cas_Cas02710)
MGAFTDFLTGVFGTWQMAALAVVATIVIFVFAEPLENLVRTLRPFWQPEVTVREVSAAVERHRGLIVLSSIGQGRSSAEQAVIYHWQGLQDEYPTPVLEQCWIITGGTESERSATELIGDLIKSGIPPEVFHMKPIPSEHADNPEAVHAVHRLVDQIYVEATQKFNLPEEQVMADYTGGTKSMTSGTILACTSPRRPLQFMKPRRYDSQGRADPTAGADPVAVDIQFELVPYSSRRQGVSYTSQIEKLPNEKGA